MGLRRRPKGASPPPELAEPVPAAADAGAPVLGAATEPWGVEVRWTFERRPFAESARLIDAEVGEGWAPVEAEYGDLVRLRPAAGVGGLAQAERERLERAGVAVSVAPELPPDAPVGSAVKAGLGRDLTQREAVEELLAAAGDEALAGYVRGKLDEAGL